jgi:membrane-associated phospholipid phosphatase
VVTRIPLLLSSLALVALTTASCATLGGRGAAGDPCRVPPCRAALDAALSPATWVPLAGALALQLGNADAELSDWARDETPIFGSTDAARDASDVLYWGTVAGYGVSALAASGGGPAGDCQVGFFGRLAAGLGAQAATSGMTELIKNGTDRERPDGSNRDSFVSGHAASVGLAATLAGRNLERTVAPARTSAWMRGGLAALATGTAWARVEGGRHYPSDVLAGIALGHFIAAFTNDALLGRATGAVPDVALWSASHGGGVSLHWTF